MRHDAPSPLDQVRACVERNCGQQFTFTEGEQKFYADRGFTPPLRCKPCREAKKARVEGRAAEAANGAPDPSTGNRRGYGGRGRRAAYDE